MLQALTNAQLERVAPSIFATHAWEGVSDRYTFIPTINVVEKLRAEGFVPVKAQQSAARSEGKGNFTRHMVRFQRVQDLDIAIKAQQRNPGHHFYERHGEIAPEIPEIVLVNSHDRSSGYQLEAGLFRLACSNGLLVKSCDFGNVSVRHSGNIVDNVIDGCFRIVDELPHILDKVSELKAVTLDRAEQEAFATAAIQVRYPDEEDGKSTSPVKPAALLNIHRNADRAQDVFTTMNVVQENLIKGGVRGVGSTGKYMRTRAIKSVNEDLRINKALWVLAEQMAALKA